jgi:hypothetical protein
VASEVRRTEVAMYARHVTVRGSAEKVDEGLKSVQDRVFPILKECNGFRVQLPACQPRQR